jgi:undecaprenyl diphosphate synthase
MDGNRRWARQNSLKAFLGHQKGAKVIQQVINFCLENKISFLSLYTFSIENFNRSSQELDYLFSMLTEEAHKQLTTCLDRDVKIRFIGDRSLFPEHVKPTIDELEEKTKHCATLHLNFLFCYGAQQEIIHGIKTIIKKIKQGELSEDDVSEDTFAQYLWTGGIPEPDLIIRTGGATRLSNFLLYQAAYSEFYFLDCFWPEIKNDHLQKALAYFNTCKRNFGS